MRFDSDLDPGNRTVPSIFFIGFNVSCSMAPPALARVNARAPRRLGRRWATDVTAGASAGVFNIAWHDMTRRAMLYWSRVSLTLRRRRARDCDVADDDVWKMTMKS